jgi:hypothetical protein
MKRGRVQRRLARSGSPRAYLPSHAELFRLFSNEAKAEALVEAYCGVAADDAQFDCPRSTFGPNRGAIRAGQMQLLDVNAIFAIQNPHSADVLVGEAGQWSVGPGYKFARTAQRLTIDEPQAPRDATSRC